VIEAREGNMRFIILSVLAFLFQSLAFAGSGFEGTYKVQRITTTTGPWSDAFWGRPDINQLSEILLEDVADNLYINLKDSEGKTWSANYGVCTGNGEYCNAHKSADGQTLEIEFTGDWQTLKITLGQQQGQMKLTGDKGPASLVFEYIK
jgi:hypothetical protein